MELDGKWTYNETEDSYWNNDLYDSRKEAIAAGRKEYPNRDFYIGQCESIEIPTGVDAEKIIERIGDRFFDEAMEHHDELQESLEKVVKEWLDKHKFCEGCFVVRNVELIRGEVTK